MKLEKAIATRINESRRKIEAAIKDGLVKVNGKVVIEPFYNVELEDSIFYKNNQFNLDLRKQHVYYLFHKPVKTICTKFDPQGRQTIYDVIPKKLLEKYNIFTVGRLDFNTSGLILLTNDGEFANMLSHPRYKVPKTYYVKTKDPITKQEIDKLRDGIFIDRTYKTQPAKIRVLTSNKLEITIFEGKNRQIHKMMEKVGHSVQKLRRIRYGKFSIDGLPQGAILKLSENDVKKII